MGGGIEYIRDPAEIYRQSFAEISGDEKLEQLPQDLRDVAIRVIHACGMPDIVDDLRFSAKSVTSGRRAIRRGAALYCDVESVRSGIMKRLLPETTDIHCRISSPDTETHARTTKTTRAAAQVDLWGERLTGSIVVIGNAPTMLFRLLEAIDEGLSPPALVVAFPVGFVGAAESKAELFTNPRDMELITLLGKRGGSAMAAAAMNAVAAGLST